jgi:Glycosyl hydrolases family 38 N-terminal domain
MKCLENFAKHYKTNHIMITAGMDFAWQFAHVNYKFFDNVTALYSNHTFGRKFKFIYSTVDDYFTAIQKKQKELKFNWPEVNTDFFPYNGFHVAHYWTGYYTSRPNFKKLIRDFTGLTQASDTFYAIDII